MHFPVTATSMYHEHDGPKQNYKLQMPQNSNINTNNSQLKILVWGYGN